MLFATGRLLEGGLLAVCQLNDASTLSVDVCNQPWQRGVKHTHNLITHIHKPKGAHTGKEVKRPTHAKQKVFRSSSEACWRSRELKGLNQPWQTGGGPSICSLSPSRQVRISLPTMVKPGWHEYRIMSPVKSFAFTVTQWHIHTDIRRMWTRYPSHKNTNTNLHQTKSVRLLTTDTWSHNQLHIF